MGKKKYRGEAKSGKGSLARVVKVSTVFLEVNFFNLPYYNVLASCAVLLIYLNEEAVA